MLVKKRGKLLRDGKYNTVPVNVIGGKRMHEMSEDELLTCARDYYVTGNLSEIARNRKVCYKDLCELIRTPWFQEELKIMERETKALLKVKLTNMLGKSLEELENRLDNGDMVWKDKELRNVPIPAKDLALIATAIFAKKKEIEESETGIVSNEAKRLLNLAIALKAKNITDMSKDPIDVVNQNIIAESLDDSLIESNNSEEE
jgi:hypothetical protein